VPEGALKTKACSCARGRL